jgi:hypothetical protein
MHSSDIWVTNLCHLASYHARFSIECGCMWHMM